MYLLKKTLKYIKDFIVIQHNKYTIYIKVELVTDYTEIHACIGL